MTGIREESVSEGLLSSQRELQTLLNETLPSDDIVYAFGYGSGVLSQQSKSSTASHLPTSNNENKNMIDLIVAVKDSYSFHQANMQTNPSHYSPSYWTHDPVARTVWWQRHELDTRILRNPKVYFNVTDTLKYGVVQHEDLIADLEHWKYLYLAGRMLKPTLEIVNRSDAVVQAQSSVNLPAALAAALLLCGSSSQTIITDTSVYTTIASLSYRGDFRVAAGAEDPDKVRKLVTSSGQLERFDLLYRPAIQRLERQGLLSRENEVWMWDSSSSANEHLLSQLPDKVQQSVSRTNIPETLEAALIGIVAPAARYQSAKGLVTAGWSKSLHYAVRKLSKGIFRKR